MPLANINFTTSDGNLGIVAPSNDAICGILWYQDGTEMTPASYTTLAEVLAEATSQSVTLGDEVQYHIAEYFRMNPGGTLWFRTHAADAEQADLEAFQVAASGEMRQVAVGGDFGTTDDFDAVCAELAAAAEALFAAKRGLFVLVQPDRDNQDPIVETGPFAVNAPALLDTKRFVGVITGGDGDEADTFGLGTALGLLASLPVNVNIGSARRGQLSDGSKYTSLTISDVDYDTFTAAQLNTIDAARVNFPRKLTGLPGAFFNFDYTLATATSDYGKINRCRVIQKVQRVLNTKWAYLVNQDFKLAADGTIDFNTIQAIKADGAQVLDLMVAADEISGYLIEIDPAQNVLSTGTLAISAAIQPRGEAKTINVTLLFQADIS